MKTLPRYPLLAKVLGWLFLHLAILALAFAGFVGWQLGLGLDSLLSGSAGDRLRAFGDSARTVMLDLPPSGWNEAIKPLAEDRHVRAAMFDPSAPQDFPIRIPANVLERSRISAPPLPVRRGPPPRDIVDPADDGIMPFPEGPEFRPPPPARRRPSADAGNRRDDPLPPAKPVFLTRGEGGDGYWAGIQVILPGRPGEPRHPRLLLVRSDTLDGSGMFFDFKPWLWGGMAVLSLSIAFWTPFVLGITRYVQRLTAAAHRIAVGQFSVSLPDRGNDELGDLGVAIETMATRLDHLISGQKRFLGDAAHELCAPLARLRTGLGILEMKLAASEMANLAQIESDSAELAMLVEEILAFSRAGNRAPRLETVLLNPLIREIVARECGEMEVTFEISPGITVVADKLLLGRAIGNLIRNTKIHAGPDARISIHALNVSGNVEILVEDDGPGVPVEELPKLFEPFYRPDLSRSRDTGGTGLGLAIVRTAVEACGGTVEALIPPKGGFAVSLRLQKPLS